MSVLPKIGVFYDGSGEVSDIYSAEQIIIYEGEPFWKEVGSHKLELQMLESIVETKKQAFELVKLLDTCSIIITRKCTGILFQMLTMQGYYIFEMDSVNQTMLEEVYEEVCDMKNHVWKSQETTVPIETDVPGIYFLDLMEVQKHHPDITTKKALASFFEQTPFVSLKLKYQHIPPWIEEKSDLEIKELKENGTIYFEIIRKSCN